MTRDGTVGRSDATEPNLAFHRDIDPVRMMRTRFADPIRASRRGVAALARASNGGLIITAIERIKSI